MSLSDSLPRHLLQNALMGIPLVKRFARRWHHMGMGRSAERILPVFTRLLQMSGRPLEKQTVLELGPGQTPDLLFAALLLGARKSVGLDVSPYLDEGAWDVETYRDTRQWLGPAMKRGELGRQPGWTPERFTNVNRIDASHLQLELYDGRHFPLPDASVDLIWSKSVLEHVSEYTQVIDETWRVLRPGGVACHIIDLRDHLTLHNGRDWLRFLRYSAAMWNRIADNRTSWCNRLRLPDWTNVFEANPWQDRVLETETQPLHAEFDRAALDPAFRELGDEDLSVSWIYVTVSKPA